MSSTVAEPPALQGLQEPRSLSIPEYEASSGTEAVELARMAGLDLDPWQQLVLRHSLGEKPNGKWAAFEVGLIVPRQNGKGAILEARELAGLFVLGERFIVHSAHQFDTSLEAFRRLMELIEGTPSLSRRVKRVVRSHGEEGVELHNGQRVRFRTRTKGGGRGFSGDCLILDEAMYLPQSAHGALLPTLSARPNPQVWYAGSAVDEQIHDHGVVFSRIRERGLKGDPALAFFEWGVDADVEDADEELCTDSDNWAIANPGLGIRITPDYVANEQRSMDPRTFAVERLGIGAWPPTDALGDRVIAPEDWRALIDKDSVLEDPIYLSVDVTPDRHRTAIAAAGHRSDGLAHVEIVEHRAGTGWVADRLAELVSDHNVTSVVLDASGPVASLVPDFEERGLLISLVNAPEHARACGVLVDAVAQKLIRHLGTKELDAAIRGAVKRPLTDAWAWSRKSSALDICPLVASTLALSHILQKGPSVYESRGMVAV